MRERGIQIRHSRIGPPGCPEFSVMNQSINQTSYKVHYVSLGVAPTLHPNHKKSFPRFTKQINLYRSMERILYHLVLVVGGWLLKMLKIVEELSGLYGSATIA